MSYTAAVITVSDLGSRGLRQDTSGPAVAAMLAEAGFTVTHTAMVPDEQPQISAELRRCADELGIALIVTTGGTGLSPRDVTPARPRWPDGFTSLCPVLRLNAELRDGRGYMEFNTAAEKDGRRGWLNIACREDAPYTREGRTTTFRTDFLTLAFTAVGVEGGCPAEKDNAGCFFLRPEETLRPAEAITANKEFCDCTFRWSFTPDDAHGVSLGKTLPAVPEPASHTYPRQALTPEHAARIPCTQVLGAYTVRFQRQN